LLTITQNKSFSGICIDKEHDEVVCRNGGPQTSAEARASGIRCEALTTNRRGELTTRPFMPGARAPGGRFVMVRFVYVPVVLSLSVGFAAPVRGQDLTSPLLAASGEASAVDSSASPPHAALVAAPLQERRPAALLPLYVSFGALQGLDAHSTSRALRRNAVEANPLMKGLASHGVGMLAVKAAGTAGLIYASERIWKQNRAAGVIFMLAANSAMVWVVQHNYRAVR
jgi:hypothetical protein